MMRPAHLMPAKPIQKNRSVGNKRKVVKPTSSRYVRQHIVPRVVSGGTRSRGDLMMKQRQDVHLHSQKMLRSNAASRSKINDSFTRNGSPDDYYSELSRARSIGQSFGYENNAEHDYSELYRQINILAAASRDEAASDHEEEYRQELQLGAQAEHEEQMASVLQELDEANSKLKSETTMRKKVEKRNRELNERLTEVRETLHETRGALQKLQVATEDIIAQRDERDLQHQKVQQHSKTQELRIKELEEQMYNSPSSDVNTKLEAALTKHKAIIAERDNSIHALEDQIYELQAQVNASSRECKRLMEEKREADGLLEASHQKIMKLTSEINDVRYENDSLIAAAASRKVAVVQANVSVSEDKNNTPTVDNDSASNPKLESQAESTFHPELINKLLDVKLNSFAMERTIMNQRLKNLESLLHEAQTRNTEYQNAMNLKEHHRDGPVVQQQPIQRIESETNTAVESSATVALTPVRPESNSSSKRYSNPRVSSSQRIGSARDRRVSSAQLQDIEKDKEKQQREAEHRRAIAELERQQKALEALHERSRQQETARQKEFREQMELHRQRELEYQVKQEELRRQQDELKQEHENARVLRRQQEELLRSRTAEQQREHERLTRERELQMQREAYLERQQISNQEQQVQGRKSIVTPAPPISHDATRTERSPRQRALQDLNRKSSSGLLDVPNLTSADSKDDDGSDEEKSIAMDSVATVSPLRTPRTPSRQVSFSFDDGPAGDPRGNTGGTKSILKEAINNAANKTQLSQSTSAGAHASGELVDSSSLDMKLLSKIRSVKKEIDNMVRNQRQLKQQIQKFNKDFIEQYGRKAEKEDRRKYAKEMYNSYHQGTRILNKRIQMLAKYQEEYNGASMSAKVPVKLDKSDSSKSLNDYSDSSSDEESADDHSNKG